MTALAARPMMTTTTTTTPMPVPSTARSTPPAGTSRPARTTETALHDEPVALPQPRGPLTTALLAALVRDPHRSLDLRHLSWEGEAGDALLDEDLQLALWLAYELHYRGLAGVDERWEWHPELLWARARWEDHLVAGLELAVPRPDAVDAVGVVAELTALAEADAGPSLSKFLMREATAAQFDEFLVHRSLYHLKEADPHSWAIPRLSGRVKAALVTIQADEYGGGDAPTMHAQLFRALLADRGLATAYGAHLERVPAVTLLATNVISLLGLHRRWRGALVGHLAAFEMSSSTPNARYARGFRRLGGGEAAARFFDEHVVADAVHEQIALHDLAAGQARVEPALAPDVVFGARAAAHVDQLFGEHLLGAWADGASSLRVVA